MKEFFRVEQTLNDGSTIEGFYSNWKIAQEYKDYLINECQDVILVTITWYAITNDKNRFTRKYCWTY